MLKKFLSRFVQMILTLLLATFAIFLLLRAAPVDPITLMISKPAGQIVADKALQEKEIQRLKEEHGLNDSLMKQYFTWIKNISSGHLGKSIVTGQNIQESIARFLPNSLYLAVLYCIIQLVLAGFLGFFSAYYYNKWPDHLIRLLCILLRSLPSFVICLLLLSLFATKLGVYQISTSAGFSRLWLPAIAAGLTTFPQLSRIIRNSILDELGRQYVASYISKGFSKFYILKEAFRNALLPIFTSLSISFAGSIGGMIVTENIFSWPGIGDYGICSILYQDYPAIQAYVLVVTIFVILINFLTDTIYPLINPLLRKESNR